MRFRLAASAAVIGAILMSSGAYAEDKKQLAFVVNGASDFWKLAEAGVKKAQAELPNYQLSLKYPEQAAAAVQQRLMDDLVSAGVSAIMVSAVDPKSSTEALNRIGGQVPLFTTDSDAPDTNRIAYIGSSNTDAGKQAGQIAVKALAGRRQVHRLRRAARRRQCARAHRRHESGAGRLEGRADRRPRRRHRPDPRQAQCRGRACRQSRHQLHGRLLFLQHAAYL